MITFCGLHLDIVYTMKMEKVLSLIRRIQIMIHLQEFRLATLVNLSILKFFKVLGLKLHSIISIFDNLLSPHYQKTKLPSKKVLSYRISHFWYCGSHFTDEDSVFHTFSVDGGIQRHS